MQLTRPHLAISISVSILRVPDMPVHLAPDVPIAVEALLAVVQRWIDRAGTVATDHKRRVVKTPAFAEELVHVRNHRAVAK